MKKLTIPVIMLFFMVSNAFGQSELKIRKSTTGLTLIELIDNNRNVFIGENNGEQANSFNGGNTGVGDGALQLLSTGSFNTALGNSALSSTRTGHSNVGIGSATLLNNNGGIWNVAVGTNSILQNISGVGNVAMGNESLYSTLSNYNTSIGHEAGRSTTGKENIFIGGFSGRNNDGESNVYIGYESGKNILGSNKLVIENSDVDSTEALIYGEFDNNLLRLNADVNINGAYTLPSTPGTESQILTFNGNNEAVWDSLILMDQDSTNELIKATSSGYNSIWIAEGTTGHIIDLHVSQATDGDNDTGFYVDKGYTDEDVIRFDVAGTENVVMEKNANGTFRMEIIDPNDNTAVGFAALLSNDSGIGNTAYARNALRFNQTGNGNVALGRAAMQFSVSGNYNTYVGDLAGFRNDGGSFNVGLGNLTLAENVTGVGNVGIGHFAGYHETGSNKLYIANDSVRFDEALIYGEFDNQLLRVNGELNINGDYTLPTDTASVNQYMIMGADGNLKWHFEPVKYGHVLVDWGWIRTTKEIYDGTDTFDYETTYQIQTPMIIDEDGDTKIEVQEFGGLDDDAIRFRLGGQEQFVMKNNIGNNLMLEILNSSQNIFVGENAGVATTTGFNNTMIGNDSGESNTFGYNNVYIGSNAGKGIDDGAWNTFVGSKAGELFSSGNQNTFVGEVSGQQANGARNSFFGIGSGRYIDGDKNVAVGNNAGLNATGDSNVLIGSEAGYNSNGGNKLYIENTTADSTGALIYGEFDNNKLRLNAEVNINGNYNLPTTSALQNQFLIMGPDGQAVWHQQGPQIVNTSLDYGFFIEEVQQVSSIDTGMITNVYAIETPMIIDEDGDTKIEVQELNGADIDVISFDISGDEKMSLSNAGLKLETNLGIGIEPAYPIHINDPSPRLKLATAGNIGATSLAVQDFYQVRLSNATNNEYLGVDMTAETFEPYQNDTLTLGTASYKWKEVYATNATINTSDRRFKKNINDMSYGLEEVMQMRPVMYEWKKEKNGRKIAGFIAQEMEKIVPEAVHVSEVIPNPNKPDSDSEYSELYGMRYTELIPVLTKAIQDQQGLIQNQQDLIQALTERIEALEKK